VHAVMAGKTSSLKERRADGENRINEICLTTDDRQDAPVVISVNMKINATFGAFGQLVEPTRVSALADVDNCLKHRRCV